MKELTELENAMNENEHSVEPQEVYDAAQRLITRLKECDLGNNLCMDARYMAAKHAYSFGWYGPVKEIEGKSGQLYFVAEESET